MQIECPLSPSESPRAWDSRTASIHTACWTAPPWRAPSPPAAASDSAEASLLSRLGQIIERGANAALAMADAGEFQSHLDSRQRAGQHQIVEIAQMSDANDLARQFSEPRSQRHIKVVQHHCPEGRFV